MLVKRLIRAAGPAALVGTGVLAAAGYPTTAAQSAQVSSSDRLLVEVQQLRGEIKQAADSSLLAQLLVARLQIQEQRVNALAQQQLAVQDRLTTVRQQQDGVRQRLAATEEGQALLAPADRSDDQSRALRMQIDQLQARIDDLETQETRRTAEIATAQARWTDLDERLDALERSLPTRNSR